MKTLVELKFSTNDMGIKIVRENNRLALYIEIDCGQEVCWEKVEELNDNSEGFVELMTQMVGYITRNNEHDLYETLFEDL